MPTQTVTFGPVTAHQVTGGHAAVIGSGSQWADASDATYAEMDGVLSGGVVSAAYAAQADTPDPMTSPAVTLNARISGPAGVLHPISPVFALLTAAQVATDPSAQGIPLGEEIDGGMPLRYLDDLAGGVLSTDPDGLAHSYSVALPYTTDPFGDGVWADVADRLTAGGLYMSVFVGNAAADIDVVKIYEVSLTLTTGVAAPPPLVRHPRGDGSGLGPTQHWPRKHSRLPGRGF